MLYSQISTNIHIDPRIDPQRSSKINKDQQIFTQHNLPADRQVNKTGHGSSHWMLYPQRSTKIHKDAQRTIHAVFVDNLPAGRPNYLKLPEIGLNMSQTLLQIIITVDLDI